MHAAWIICIFSLLPFEFLSLVLFFFSPSLFCLILKLIYVQYLCIFSRFHLGVDVQLCIEHISQIRCFKTVWGVEHSLDQSNDVI